MAAAATSPSFVGEPPCKKLESTIDGDDDLLVVVVAASQGCERNSYQEVR